MTDLAFESAGKREGLQIWRIEDFALNAVVKSQHGNFYNGDCYLVLNSKRSGSGECHISLIQCVPAEMCVVKNIITEVTFCFIST